MAKKKLLPEIAKSVTGKDKIEGTAKPKNLVKEVSKSVTNKKSMGKKSPAQSLMTASPKKVMKATVKEAYKALNKAQKQRLKEYKREASLLRRRVKYLEKKGFVFEQSPIPEMPEKPKQKDIQALRELRKDKLRQLASAYEIPEGKLPPIENDFPVVSDEDFGLPDYGYEDSLENDGGYTSEIPKEQQAPEKPFSPLDFYREHPEYGYDPDADVSEGEMIIANIYADLQRQYYEIGDLDVSTEVKNVKYDFGQRLVDFIEEMIGNNGKHYVAYMLQQNAEGVQKLEEIVMFWVDSRGRYDETLEGTSTAYTGLTSIFYRLRPDLWKADSYDNRDKYENPNTQQNRDSKQWYDYLMNEEDV